MTASDPTVEQAWQQALAAEDQAYFGYPRLGPWLVAALQDQAHVDGDAHALLRDTVASAMASIGMAPAAPAADYPLPRVATSTAAVALAARLEDECATAWRRVYAVLATDSGAASVQPLPTPTAAPTPTVTATAPTTSPVPAGSSTGARRDLGRVFAQQAWTAAAVRAAQWRLTSSPGSATTPFPGL